ncbi:putative peptidoglycan binding domain-containing protein, partial [Mycobacterium tuberculosis]
DEEKVPMTDELREELEAMARAGGHRDLAAWVGTENYEMRVADDLSWIDRRILAIARGSEGTAS